MNKMKVIASFRNGKRWGEALFLALLLLYPVSMHADEGMWMLGNLNKETRKTMKELGLQMPADQLYSTRHPSLKDAVVSFGGFCSGAQSRAVCPVSASYGKRNPAGTESYDTRYDRIRTQPGHRFDDGVAGR